jgi:acyl-[acyl-carrier-protein] desaturase
LTIRRNARIRTEYGLPLRPTLQERQRGAEIGAADVCRVVALDEVAHHGLFLKIIQSHIRYFPSRTFDVLSQVVQGSEMLAVRFLPNARPFLRAVRRTDLYSSKIHHQQVSNPILKSLGFAGWEVFEQAVQHVHQLLAELGSDDVTLDRTDTSGVAR